MARCIMQSSAPFDQIIGRVYIQSTNHSIDGDSVEAVRKSPLRLVAQRHGSMLNGAIPGSLARINR